MDSYLLSKVEMRVGAVQVIEVRQYPIRCIELKHLNKISHAICIDQLKKCSLINFCMVHWVWI